MAPHNDPLAPSLREPIGIAYRKNSKYATIQIKFALAPRQQAA
jgi:hypothetical protein